MTVAQVLAFVFIWLAVPLLFCAGGFSADPGNGDRLAGLAQSLVGGWSRGFESTSADESADWCHRIYRRRQYADQ